MKRNISFERIVKTAAFGTEKEAERLCYDILFDDIDKIIPDNHFAILAAEDERFAKHIGMTYEEFLELKKKIYG